LITYLTKTFFDIDIDNLYDPPKNSKIQKSKKKKKKPIWKILKNNIPGPTLGIIMFITL